MKSENSTKLYALEIKKRLSAILAELGETRKDLERKTKLSQSRISQALNIESNQNFATGEFYLRFKQIYPSVNLNYVFTGELPMFLNYSKVTEAADPANVYNISNSEVNKTIQQLTETVMLLTKTIREMQENQKSD